MTDEQKMLLDLAKIPKRPFSDIDLIAGQPHTIEQTAHFARCLANRFENIAAQRRKELLKK